jgi:hypothetical protein
MKVGARLGTPPRKKPEQTQKRRTINGYILDVSAAAQFLGSTDKSLRAMVARRVVPFRRLNSRIIFLKEELVEFLQHLPGCSMDEARHNLHERNKS